MSKPVNIFVLLIPIIFNTLIAQSETDWFPLATGNWWLYESEGFMLDDSDTISISGTIHYEIIKALVHDSGFQIYELQSIVNTNISVDTSIVFLRYENEELRRYLSLASDLYDIWFRFDITNRKENVVVPSGSFSNCMVINLPETYGVTTDIFLHKGTGLIKMMYSSAFYNTTESLSDFVLY